MSRACSCGFRAREANGILDLTTPRQIEDYGPFLEHYNRVRESEDWGGDDLDLPFHPIRHRYVWEVRRRTFERVRQLVAGMPSRGAALDVAAGNCWLTRHLEEWGFRVTALDINLSPRDGLGAGVYYLERGARFGRIRAPAESLPVEDGTVDFVTVSGAIHYMDVEAVLAEFRRVLAPGGRAIVFDSPWYERAHDGERAVGQRVQEHERRYSAGADTGRASSYLLRAAFERAVEHAGFSASYLFPWTGFRRACDTVRARVRGQAIARFPVVLLVPAEER